MVVMSMEPNDGEKTSLIIPVVLGFSIPRVFLEKGARSRAELLESSFDVSSYRPSISA